MIRVLRRSLSIRMSSISWTLRLSKLKLKIQVALFSPNFITDFCSSFFDEANRIAAPDYIPNVADVLRARTKTTGIYETRFTMGQLSIQCVFYFIYYIYIF
jgi:hypothetical protein